MRRIAAALAGIAVFGIATTAHAVPPVIETAGSEDGHPAATFAPLSGVDYVGVYMSHSARRGSDGTFFREDMAEVDYLEDREMRSGSWLFEERLAPGRYYLMIEALDYDCEDGAACVDGLSEVQPFTIPMPALSVTRARSHVRTALRRWFDGTYVAGYLKRIRGCHRVSRLRIACRRVSWSVGDLSLEGRMSVRYGRFDGEPGWRATGRIRQTNGYCVATGGSRCKMTHHVVAKGRVR